MGVTDASREWLGLPNPYEEKCTKYDGERQCENTLSQVLPQEY